MLDINEQVILRKPLLDSGLLPGHIGTVTGIDPVGDLVTVRFVDRGGQEVALRRVRRRLLARVEPDFMEPVYVPLLGEGPAVEVLFWNLVNFLAGGPDEFCRPIVVRRGEWPMIEFSPGQYTLFGKIGSGR